MIDLVRHIENLLLENNCVVVPGFGGFITHYMPACWNGEESIFSPPLRTIGFNSQLKINDGILVQSYMKAYNTSFSDATKILDKEVNALVEILHQDGKVELTNIGEISLSVHGTYVFTSYDDKITSPFLYGLDSFEILDLRTLKQVPVAHKPSFSIPATKKTYEIRINRALVRNAVAAVAAFLLFFYMSTPIENTYVEKANYAQLLPADLFGKIEQQSLLTTSVGITLNTEVFSETETSNSDDILSEFRYEKEQEQVTKVPVTVKEIKVLKKPIEETSTSRKIIQSNKLHHIIIASVTFKDDAEVMVAEFKSKGYPNASVLIGEGRFRVSLAAYTTREEADKQLAKLRKNDTYSSAWLLIR